MAHFLSELAFGLIALLMIGLITTMLIQSRSAIAAALGLSDPAPVRRYRAPVRVKVRRTVAWPASRVGGTRRAA